MAVPGAEVWPNAGEAPNVEGLEDAPKAEAPSAPGLEVPNADWPKAIEPEAEPNDAGLGAEGVEVGAGDGSPPVSIASSAGALAEEISRAVIMPG